jgi:hypothetical protein
LIIEEHCAWSVIFLRRRAGFLAQPRVTLPS